jgi:hypothetical protein
MIFILKDIIDDSSRVTNDTHIETEKEFEGRIFSGYGEECLDSGGSPVILSDIQCETIDSGRLGALDVGGEGRGGIGICIPHHKVAEDILFFGSWHFDGTGSWGMVFGGVVAVFFEEHLVWRCAPFYGDEDLHRRCDSHVDPKYGGRDR